MNINIECDKLVEYCQASRYTGTMQVELEGVDEVQLAKDVLGKIPIEDIVDIVGITGILESIDKDILIEHIKSKYNIQVAEE